MNDNAFLSLKIKKESFKIILFLYGFPNSIIDNLLP